MAEVEEYMYTVNWYKNGMDNPPFEVWNVETNSEGEYYQEYYMLELRKERDQKLKDSDWTSFNDSPLSDEKKAEWTLYRQALRDLPATALPKQPDAESDGCVSNVTWPTEPE
tara:strand:- start:91 stop:426 length:336 start_codon:yes stop_codon:yes gene_type:complete